MNLSRFAMSHKSVVYVLSFVLVLWGIYVFQTAPRQEDPQFVIRDGFLLTIWPGATAEEEN